MWLCEQIATVTKPFHTTKKHMSLFPSHAISNLFSHGEEAHMSVFQIRELRKSFSHSEGAHESFGRPGDEGDPFHTRRNWAWISCPVCLRLHSSRCRIAASFCFSVDLFSIVVRYLGAPHSILFLPMSPKSRLRGGSCTERAIGRAAFEE